MPRLNPLNDFAFQKVLGEKGDEPQLIAFLNAVLGRTGRDAIVSVEILESRELAPELIGGKLGRLDVLAELADKSLVNIEVQLENEHNMEKRSFAYLAKLLSSRMKEGWDYKELPRVIGINIINFDYIPLEDFHTSFHFREDKRRDYVLTDMVEIHFLNMVRFRKVRNKDIINDPLHRWLVYFDERSPESMVQEAVEIDDSLKKIREKLGIIEMDPDLYRTYLSYEKAAFDEVNRLRYAEDKGLARGLKRGIKRGRKEGREEAQAEAAARISQISAQLDQERARVAQLQAEIERLKTRP